MQWHVEFGGQPVPFGVLWVVPEIVQIVGPMKAAVEQVFASADPGELADVKFVACVESDEDGASLCVSF